MLIDCGQIDVKDSYFFVHLVNDEQRLIRSHIEVVLLIY